jgi:hypothetical protein
MAGVFCLLEEWGWRVKCDEKVGIRADSCQWRELLQEAWRFKLTIKTDCTGPDMATIG